MPFPLRTSDNTTERNYFLEHIRRIDSLRNFDSSEAASKIDQLRHRAKTQRVINPKNNTPNVSMLNKAGDGKRKYTQLNSKAATKSVMSKLNKEQK